MSIRSLLALLLVAAWLNACSPSQPHAIATAQSDTSTPDPTAFLPGTPAVATATLPALPSPASALAPTAASTPTLPPTATPACTEREGKLSILSLSSPVLGRLVAYSFYTPPCYAANPARLYPALYLLHGANADHTQWPDLNVAPGADALVAQHRAAPFVVVMPGGEYLPGEDYAAFVLRDLVPAIEQSQHIASDRQHRAIGGLSLGGAWALELALTHPESFSAVGGHSPVSDRALKGVSPAALGAVRIYLDVGKDDPLASDVAAFANQLALEGFAPLYHVYPGGHDRPYWRAHTAEYLAFYAAAW